MARLREKLPRGSSRREKREKKGIASAELWQGKSRQLREKAPKKPDQRCQGKSAKVGGVEV